MPIDLQAHLRWLLKALVTTALKKASLDPLSSDLKLEFYVESD